ncbi:MAG: alpha/beta hydrolase [Halioglobus sp.]
MSSEQLKALVNAIPESFASPEADFRAVRAMFKAFHGHPISDDLSLSITHYGTVRCGEYSLKGAQNGWTAFHCHGGAFVSTPVDEYHFYAELIAQRTGCDVIMPDYRLAPENLFPAAHDDCYNAYRGMLEAGLDPARVIFMGESCGGSLAIGTLLRARDEGLPLPAAFISLTGWFDLSVSGEPVTGRDPFLTPEWVRNRGHDYLGPASAQQDTFDTEQLKHPLLSPAYADLHGLPPLYLQVGERDTLREGQLALARSAEKAGVTVALEHWPDCIHGWHGLASTEIPEAVAAWNAIRDYIEAMDSPLCPRKTSNNKA